MDTFDIGSINYNELYKLHTGHVLFDSDSDSSDSSIESSSFWEKNKPSLYTYEELKANMAVKETITEPVGIQRETKLIVCDSHETKTLELDQAPNQILRKKLENLISSNYCYLCNADLGNEANAQSHYNSNRHKNNLAVWKNEEKSKLQSSRITMAASKTVGKGQSPNQILRKKLEILICSNYCYLCNADLEHEANAQSHYNSYRHKNNLSVWKNEEKRKLQSSKITTESSKTVEQVQVRQTLEKDLSPNQILRKKLKNLVCSNYCLLCNANLPQRANARSHYDSDRHKNNVYAWRTEEMKKLHSSKLGSSVSKTPVQVGNSVYILVPVQNDSNKIGTRTVEPKVNQNDGKPGVDPLCRICGINVGTELQEHYKSESHKRCVEVFCFICNIRTMSKQQLAEHVNGFRHKYNLDIKKKQKDNKNKELLPNTKSNTQITVSDVNKGTQVASKSVPLPWRYCDVCKKDLDSTENAERHCKTAAHIMKNNFYCHVCKLKFDSITKIDSHVSSFPHNETSRLMSIIVSKGISTRNVFWKFNFSKIRCSLCDVSIQSERTAADHFGSKRHVLNFNEWCSAQSKDIQDPNRRWYYCDICNLSLDGTTKVELHYHGVTHARIQKRLTNTSQASNTCDATHILIPESRDKEKLDGVDNKQQQELHKRIEIDKLDIFNASSQIPCNTEYKTLQEQTKCTSKTSALQSHDTQVSTKETIVDSKISNDAKNAVWLKPTENMFTIIASKSKDTQVSIKETILDTSKISSDAKNPVWLKQTENMFTFNAPKSKDTQVSTKETIVDTSKISSDAKNPVWLKKTENMFTFNASKSKDTQVSTKETIVDTSKISSDCKNPVWLKQTENMFTFNAPKSKDTQVSTKETIVDTSKISSDAKNPVWLKQPENMFTFNASKSKDTQVSTKETIVDNSNILFATKNEKQHAERVENITMPIFKNEHTTPDTSTISRTDASTKTRKIEDSDKSNSTVEKEEHATHLQETVQAEIAKLTCTLKRIPPSEALFFLQKYTEELQNFSKNVNASTVNVQHEDIKCEDIFESANVKRKSSNTKNTKNKCVIM